MDSDRAEEARRKLRRKSRRMERKRKPLPPVDYRDDDGGEGSSSQTGASSSSSRPPPAEPLVDMDDSQYTPTLQFSQQDPAMPEITPAPAQHLPPTHTTLLAKRATVVTVYATESANTSVTGGNGAVAQGSNLPIGIIAGSVGVGVALAVGIVGGYMWWGKKTSKAAYKGKGHRTNPSASKTRLAPQTPNSPGSLADEKKSAPSPPSHRPGSGTPRSHSSSRETIPTLSANPTPPPRAHAAPGRPPPPPISEPESPVTGARRSSSLTSPSDKPGPVLASPSKGETDAQNDSPPSSRPGTGKSYLPQKRSPLAMGADPRVKPKERPKVNEWARPISPSSLTRSKESEYSSERSSEGGDHQLSAIPPAPSSGRHQLLSPPTSSSNPDSATATAVDSSILMSHQHKKSTSDGSTDTGSSGSFSGYYMHDDEPWRKSPSPPPPMPVMASLDMLAAERHSSPQPSSASHVPLPPSASSSTSTPTSAQLMPGSWQQSQSPSRQLLSSSHAPHIPLPPSSTPSPIPPSYQPPTHLHSPPAPLYHSPPLHIPPPSAWTQNHQASASSTSFGTGGPRAFSRASQLSNDTFYTGVEDHHMASPNANASFATIPAAPYGQYDDEYAYDDEAGYSGGEMRDSMIGVAYGGDEQTPYDPMGHSLFVPPMSSQHVGRRPYSPRT